MLHSSGLFLFWGDFTFPQRFLVPHDEVYTKLFYPNYTTLFPVIARAIVAVLFGHAIHALREEYGDNTITVKEAHELQQTIEGLTTELSRVQQDMQQQFSSELAAANRRLTDQSE